MFCVFKTEVSYDGDQAIEKVVLITWVGGSVSVIKKARSSAHRAEVADYVIQTLPFHSHYPANDPDELDTALIHDKLRS